MSDNDTKDTETYEAVSRFTKYVREEFEKLPQAAQEVVRFTALGLMGTVTLAHAGRNYRVRQP